jgi:mannose/cellobiose epimerase-like protein (N-acyl-D-glucosamine 2-epimerase family)
MTKTTATTSDDQLQVTVRTTLPGDRTANMAFTFADTIAGYVTGVNHDQGRFGLKTSDGREFEVNLTETLSAEVIRNLNEPYADATGLVQAMIEPGRFLFAYGIFYPQGGGHSFEAKRIVFVGRDADEYAFERRDWWVEQARSLADFYLRWQFEGADVDYRAYRTVLGLSGAKKGDFRQETDTISRLVYGFATAFLLTGDDRYLNAAERGTEYLRDHMRFFDTDEDIVYWYHGIDVKGDRDHKVFASEFGDDYHAIPMYEQIYALAGPTQTYRATGDPRILNDIELTVRLFDRFFLDRHRGGYYSHLDPVTMDAHSETLGRNRARKNWNSVGDHAPAYLINAYLATGEPKYADFLVYTADTIVRYFPDFDRSPFVQERFHDDWSHDTEWGWQQNRAVVGHNLKIAWNLMRINSLRPNASYVELSEKIAAIMPPVGSDRQRGGWYDVMERALAEGQNLHRLTWHDRKAWWQQEQAILAYLILAGILGRPEYLRHAREAAAFYNAFFLDHEDGAVYFNVLANGLPYLLGTERLKGSHSMSNYHASELCYLAATYSNLLINRQPLELHFRPQPNAFKHRKLRVMPDLLPPGRVRLDQVWLDESPYTRFDAERAIVNLPDSAEALKIRVRLTPVE